VTKFDRDTALEPAGGGSYRGAIDRAWWIQAGPNGGYVAAIVLRALTLAVDDPARTPRSFTVHYLAPPVEGPVEVAVTVEREGRSLTFLSARMTQEGRLVATALAAFASTRPGPEFCDLVMPEVPPPAEVPVRTMEGPRPPLVDQYEQRAAIGGAPFSGGPSVSGGWLKLAEPRLADHLLVAAFMDAWLPPVFIRTTTPLAVPTVDLSIHFRHPLPVAGAEPDDFYLAVFRSQVAAEGFVEEDGELWTADGHLLAQSRQLAVLLEPR
jgi:acyl-CoA thioesterase